MTRAPQFNRTRRRDAANAPLPDAPTGAEAAHAPAGSPLPLPHERDAATGHVADQPDPTIQQAKRDLDRGLVDTDMRATPGLDAARRAELVPGAGGAPEPQADVGHARHAQPGTADTTPTRKRR